MLTSLIMKKTIPLPSCYTATNQTIDSMLFFNTIYFQDWELLVLHKLRWELSSTTANDYLDHIIHRLCLPSSVDIRNLRAKTETIIALAATDYHFSYKPPSLMAATSILTALRSCNSETKTKTTTSHIKSITSYSQNTIMKSKITILSPL